MLVNTTGLAGSVAITGSATVSSTNAGSHATTLSTIRVVVVQGGNGTKAVATPGTALLSTKKSLKQAKAKVSLTLPKAKITKKASAGAAGPSAGTHHRQPPAGGGHPRVARPLGGARPVPTHRDLQVRGQHRPGLRQLLGLHLQARTPSWPWSSSSTASTCRQDRSTSSSPTARPSRSCPPARRPRPASPPRVSFGKEQVLGSAAHDTVYAQDTVYFTGNDPAMGRR